ncbi:efflux RND transporter periplasmic adaptor subunit [Olivibacter sp. SDN3]|uniref:efflux RND transporter periplasmic adaptor subunit n=1 Tax=Olivibacter sp. SDN3 TaxID=2764720 RepID=UPI001651080C|nr:efflux RND transporter periplasmic adaptor subunit [Olivibacter sp. SDN3]QNL49199.1 efflux RND transporter periplasmic adaptor subunit [Olivibacter sp. SDN3]
MNINRIITLCCFSPIVCIFAKCASPSNSAEKARDDSNTAVIETFQLTKGQLVSVIRIPGELIAYQQVDIYAKVNSFVKRLYVDVGSEVKAGQLLAAMEAPEITSQLSGAASRLKSQEAVYLASKATYDRLLETSKTPGTVSQNDLDLALAKQNSDLAQFEAAKAAYKEVDDNKNYLEIRAPFAGIITGRNVSSGAYVGPSGKGSELPIFTLQEQDKLRLVVSVPELYSSYLKKQHEVSFTVKALPHKPFTAKVNRLAGALDTRLRAQRVEMDVNNTDKQLLPGMITEVDIPLNGQDETFIVPSESILESTMGTYIIKVEHDSTKWVPIKLGRQTDDKTEIYGNLNENEQMIKLASEEIRDQSPVAGTLNISQ